MVNTWIEKLKVFNKDGKIWAIPLKNTPERKLLDEGKQFRYTLALHGTPVVSKMSYDKPSGGKSLTVEEKVKRIKEPEPKEKEITLEDTEEIENSMNSIKSLMSSISVNKPDSERYSRKRALELLREQISILEKEGKKQGLTKEKVKEYLLSLPYDNFEKVYEVLKNEPKEKKSMKLPSKGEGRQDEYYLKKIENLFGYYPENWKTLSSKNKQDAYSDISQLIGTKDNKEYRRFYNFIMEYRNNISSEIKKGYMAFQKRNNKEMDWFGD